MESTVNGNQKNPEELKGEQIKDQGNFLPPAHLGANSLDQKQDKLEYQELLDHLYDIKSKLGEDQIDARREVDQVIKEISDNSKDLTSSINPRQLCVINEKGDIEWKTHSILSKKSPEKQSISIGIVGKQKIGKSSFLRQISGLNFAVGENQQEQTTKGIVYGYVETESLFLHIFDCEGIDSQQQMLESEDQGVNKIEGAQTMRSRESKLMNLMQYLSDILIIMGTSDANLKYLLDLFDHDIISEVRVWFLMKHHDIKDVVRFNNFKAQILKLSNKKQKDQEEEKYDMNDQEYGFRVEVMKDVKTHSFQEKYPQVVGELYEKIIQDYQNITIPTINMYKEIGLTSIISTLKTHQEALYPYQFALAQFDLLRNSTSIQDLLEEAKLHIITIITEQQNFRAQIDQLSEDECLRLLDAKNQRVIERKSLVYLTIASMGLLTFTLHYDNKRKISGTIPTDHFHRVVCFHDKIKDIIRYVQNDNSNFFNTLLKFAYRNPDINELDITDREEFVNIYLDLIKRNFEKRQNQNKHKNQIAMSQPQENYFQADRRCFKDQIHAFVMQLQESRRKIQGLGEEIAYLFQQNEFHQENIQDLEDEANNYYYQGQRLMDALVDFLQN